MKTGNISETVLKRTVVKAISYKNKKVKIGTTVGGDAAVVQTNGGSVVATATAGLFMPRDFFNFELKRALLNAMNNVAARKGMPIAATMNIILPERLREISLYRIMEKATEICKEYNVQVAGGNTDICRFVNGPIVNVTVIGELIGDIEKKHEIEEGMDIIMAGYIATSGTAMIAKLKKEELKEYFSDSYLKGAFNCENEMSILNAAITAGNCGAIAMHDLGRGGISGALFELSERIGKGVEIELSEIPVRQETIEVTEHFGLNPYKMISDGALLIVAKDGLKVQNELINEGINARVIGKVTGNNDKIYLKGDERRFIESPKDDDIFTILDIM